MSESLGIYQQKPTKVEAMQVPPAGQEYAKQGKELTDWLDANKVEYGVHPTATVYLKTPDAWTPAKPGEYIVKEEGGCFRAVDGKRFHMNYEQITSLMLLMNQVRPIIQKIALKAEQKMSLHDPQKGDSWKQCDIKFLEDKLVEEVKEYFDEGTHKCTRRQELADIVAVCAMLYARICTNAEQEKREEE